MLAGVAERRAYARDADVVGDLLVPEFLVGPYSSSHADDFNDNVFDWVKWPNSYGAVDEVGTRGRLPCTTGYSGIATQAKYSFDQVFAQLFPPALAGATSECYLSFLVQSAKQNTAVPGTDIGTYIDRVGGTINFINWVGFFDPDTVTITYDPVAHAWVRMRMLSGQLLWETAPDGATWTIRRTLETPPAWLINTDMQLFFECHRSDGTANFAEVDNFNVPPFSTVAGSISDTLGGLTAPAAGTRTVTGSIADALGGLTAPAVGTRTVPGSISGTLGGLTAPATGTAVGRITPRPDAGVTPRPTSGITARPFAGITARP